MVLPYICQVTPAAERALVANARLGRRLHKTATNLDICQQRWQSTRHTSDFGDFMGIYWQSKPFFTERLRIVLKPGDCQCHGRRSAYYEWHEKGRLSVHESFAVDTGPLGISSTCLILMPKKSRQFRANEHFAFSIADTVGK